MVVAALVASLVLMVTPILVLSGFSESFEEFIPFEEELLFGLLLLVLIIPISVYFALRSTGAMDEWKRRLDGLSFALRFESQRPTGESPNARLANQALNALDTNPSEFAHIVDQSGITNSKIGSETYDVVVPERVTKALSGHEGVLIAKRFEGAPVREGDVIDLLNKVRSSGVHVWRLLIVSDREFSPEAYDYLAALSSKRFAFPIDLIQETPLGFSVVSLGY